MPYEAVYLVPAASLENRLNMICQALGDFLLLTALSTDGHERNHSG